MAAVAKDLDQVQEEALGENGIHDMINMNKLTEDTILRNIQKRFGKNIIYTNIGAILVAMNPYQVLPIYTQKAVEAYVGKQLGALPPHIFATADSAFRAMGEMRKNQAIIISGDSGSGKTETTKLILQYLASMTQKHSEVEQMILETSPILESFGNAKTVRNNNSSRFGKFMEIHFDKDQRICGCKISQYLLEKSRIVFQAQNERNFHIFYQLCAGATDDEKARWMLKEPPKFSYLNQSGCVEINGVDDSENFDRTRFALTLLGMNEDVQDEIFAILAAVLHLGDIRFAAAGEGSKVVDMVPVENAAKLLKIDSKQLAYLLCNRNLTIRGTTTAVLLNPKLAESSRDALAKILYKRLFEWLVARINTAILKPGKQFFIGVLDIFGFENFKINSFEQFCIDYANEKLQQHFNHALFKLEQEEYDKESINWSKIAFKDNSECIDLIEKPNPPGIISILDEESRFPKATDLTFLDKLSQKFNTHNHFAKPKLAKSSFIVKHYAGDVEYQVENFLDKNKDTVTEDMLAMLVAAKVGTVQAIFKSDADEAKQQSANRRTIATQFRTNLAELMTTLSSCHAFYVRCIKPNGLQQAVTFDQDMVLAQLRYTGMMDTIRIRKLGYPIRWPLFEFYRRYEILVPNSKWDAKDPRGVSNTLLNKLALTPDNWQLGKTKVFLRDKEYAALEARRNERIAKTVLIIQSWWKMMMLRLRFKQMRRSAVIIQKHVRRHRLRKRFVAQRAAVKTLQATIRMAKTRKAQMPRLIEHKKKLEEERKKRIEDERRRKEAAEKAAKDREEQLLREELERRKREKEEGASFAKEEERRKKEAEKAAKEAAKEAEKAAKEAEKNKKKGGKSDPGADGETAAEEEDDEVDPSWDMLRGAGSGPGSGSPSAGPSPVAGTSPSKADNPRSGTLSRSLKLEQDSSTGVKTLRATGMGDGLGTMRMGTMTLRRKHGKPITTIPAAPQIQKSGTETWVDFALRYFQGGSAAPKQGTATLKRNTKPSSPSEAMAYQNKAIKESLLPLKFELQKLAVQIFSKLLLYLENGPPSKPGKSDKWLAVQFVQHQGITVPDVRDEIYCQIIKLTYQNTNKTELPRAWQLLVFMIAVFLPSPTLLPYLSNYITTNMNKKDEISQIAEYANRALNRSHANKIRRQQPCSHAELDVLRRLEMMEIAFDVPGGTQYKIKLDSSTQVGEVIALLAAKREIPDPVGYAVYEVYDKTARLEQSLGVYDYIADSYGKSEVKSMVFKKKLWLHRNELPDTYGEHKMISNQLREDTVDGSFPLTEVELLTLTAYLLQVKLSKKKSATDPVKFDLKRHLPSHLIRKYTAEQWKNQLFAKHTELKLEKTPKRECKRLYIEFAMKTPHYGTTYFPMETDLKMNPLGFPAKCYIGVNSEGVHVCNYNDVRSIIKSFYFTEIEVWSYQYRTKLFYNDGKKQIQTEFNSTRGPELASLSKDYVFWLRLESQYAQCISDYDPGDDPNLLPMKVGDLVFITEKDEEAGWYIGESNDRAGSFPIAHVEVLITVPDTLAKMFAGAAGKQDPKAARMSFRKSGVAGGIEKDARSPASAVPKHLLNEGAAAAGKRDSGTLGALSGRLSVNLNAAALGPGGKTDYRKSIMQRKQQYNPASYTFEAYAKAQFMSTQSIAKEITFSSAPIKQPLVTGIDAPLYKNAVTTFTTIMKFMDDFPEKGKQRPTDLLRILFEEAIDHPQLRDEIYAQLMKQTNENGNQGHCVKGWELMAICARIFLPTEKLLPYLMAYFVNAINNKDKRPQEGALAETALTRLEVTQLGGGRTHIPSMKEIDSMLSGASIKVDVYLSDGFKRTIDIDTATIVGEVISELLKQAKLPYRNTWGLCEVISARDYDKDRALKATDNLCEIINSWRFIKPPKGVEALDFKLVYKKVIFLSERDPDLTDPRFEQLMYHQCVYNIISCKQPTVEDEMVALAGIYLQLTKANPNSSAAKTVEEMLPDVVPTPFLLTRPKTYWVPKLQAEWAKHADKDPRALRLAYVERASQWPLFGCSRFAVQYAMTKKSVVDATLAITKEGLHLLEIYSKNPLKTWQFSQISSWTPTKSAFTIVTGNLVNPRREIFRTLEADDIAVMYKAYVDSLASASIAKARSNVVVLGS